MLVHMGIRNTLQSIYYHLYCLRLAISIGFPMEHAIFHVVEYGMVILNVFPTTPAKI